MVVKERLLSLKVMCVDLRKWGIHSHHKCLGPSMVTLTSKASFLPQVTVLWKSACMCAHTWGVREGEGRGKERNGI